MKSQLIRQVNIALMALKAVLRYPFSSLLSIFTLAMTLSLPIMLYLLVNAAESWLGETPIEPQISVFMELTAEPEDILKAKIALQKNPLISRIVYVSKERALEQLEKKAALGDVMASLGENPLPNVFVVIPKNYDSASLETLSRTLETIFMVESVQFDQSWVEKIRSSLSFAHGFTLFLAFDFGLLLLLVSHNTIRMQVLSRQNEIEIASLIGAPRSFIRQPILYFALWQALFSAVLSSLIVSFLIYMIRPHLTEFAIAFQTKMPLAGLGWQDVFFLVWITSGLSLCAAYVASSYHLNKIQNSANS